MALAVPVARLAESQLSRSAGPGGARIAGERRTRQAPHEEESEWGTARRALEGHYTRDGRYTAAQRQTRPDPRRLTVIAFRSFSRGPRHQLLARLTVISFRSFSRSPQVTNASDLFPQILDGVPTDIKTINVGFDRPGLHVQPDQLQLQQTSNHHKQQP